MDLPAGTLAGVPQQEEYDCCLFTPCSKACSHRQRDLRRQSEEQTATSMRKQIRAEETERAERLVLTGLVEGARSSEAVNDEVRQARELMSTDPAPTA